MRGKLRRSTGILPYDVILFEMLLFDSQMLGNVIYIDQLYSYTLGVNEICPTMSIDYPQLCVLLSSSRKTFVERDNTSQ